MDIIQSFYYSPNKIRQEEIEYTLKKNIDKNFINNVHLFINENDYNIFINSDIVTNINYNKIILIKYNTQPKYPIFFDYCSKLDNKICCICNSDIEINIDIKYKYLLQNLINNKIIYFLTRHEYDMSCPLITIYQGSHDAFIFHSNTFKESINNIDFSYINYVQNTPGIEAPLQIFFTERLKYKLLNPCYQIVIIHHHISNIRLWTSNTKTIGYCNPTPIISYSGLIHSPYLVYPCRI